MYKLFYIAKHNMKKQRTDMITFLILTCISALIIFDCLSALFGMSRVLDDKFEEVNGAHFILFNSDSEEEIDSASRAVNESEYIIDYEMTPVVSFTAEYKNLNDDEYSSFQFIAEDFDKQKRIMNVPIPEFGHNKDDILLPYNMKSSFKIGDVIQIKFNDSVYSFNVAGYLEDPYFCSTMNITTYYVGIHGSKMEALPTAHPEAVKRFYAHKGIADISMFSEGYNTNNLESDINDAYKKYISEYSVLNPETNYSRYFLLNWDMMKGGSEFVPLVVMAILLLFAIIILVVSLIIISFSIKNFIQRNMKNTGIMEAAGYTVTELRWALTIEITLVAFLGSFLGIVIAALSFDMFGNILGSVLGISWNQPISLSVAAFTFIGLVAVVFLVSRLISRAYNKISVLDALRGGINTHNFRKNVFSFEKTALPIPLVLSLKDTFGGLKKNILLVFISMILTVATLAGFGVKENYGENPDQMLKLFGFEMGDADISSGVSGDISKDLRELNSVKNVLVQTGFEPSVIFNGKKQQAYTYAIDDFANTNNTFMSEGRMPEKANEIMVTNGVAEDLGLKVGDVVEIVYAEDRAEYIVTGINQRIERMGRSVYMLIDGAKKIVPGDLTINYHYLVTAKDNMSFDDVKSDVNRYAENKGIRLNCEDLNKVMESTVDTVSASMNGICVVILVLTLLVVVFVESLIIRAKISREWRSLGISKALGQTTLGLMVQIMLTNIPAISVGALIGAVIAESAGKIFTKAAFSLFAMKEATFDISGMAILISIAGILFVAVLTSFLTGLKVRKLIPVEMITEE